MAKDQPEPRGKAPKEARVAGIKNKLRRSEEMKKIRREKKKEKRERQDGRKAEAKAAEAHGDVAPPKLVPKTIESMREPDETTVKNNKSAPDGTAEEVDEETLWDISNDEYRQYFEKSYEPKVLITSTDNPHKRTIAFMQELSRIIPNSEPRWRRNTSIKKMVKQCESAGFTDVIIVNEDNRIPNGLVVSHLPEGPTAHFKLSNVKICRETGKGKGKDWRKITEHRPEVILNNFTTRLGHAVGRMLAAIFHYDPEFRGKRCVTFHNQRDYIFFRHHMYDIKSPEKVKLRDMGPRFTLRLRSLQKGTFDSKLGEYEWIISGRRHDLEKSRRRFYL